MDGTTGSVRTMDIQLGYWRWKVFRWNEHPNPFKGRSDLALEWLRRFQNDRLVMSELRATLSAAGANTTLWPDDRRVLEEVAARLSSGEFHVCAESSYPFHTAVATVTPPDPDAETAAEVLKAPPPSPAPAPPAPEPAPESTLSQNADAAKIAEVMKQAAQDGTPFCEECAQLAQAKLNPAAQLPPPPPPASTLPDSADPVAIAQSLQTAARNGTPFCAECERLRQAQAQGKS
jgi:hypothetical protein